MTENVIAYQIGLFYNRTQLTCTQAGFTDDFMGSPPHGLSKSGPVIDGGLMGSGSLLICEECNGGDYVQGPHSGSLIWAEFQVLTEPESHANLTSKFDFSARYTWVWDPDLNIIPFALYSGSYTFIAERTPPPPPKPPEPPELPAPEGAVIINESQTWHGDFTINESETVIIQDCDFTVKDGNINVYGILAVENASLRINSHSSTQGLFASGNAKFYFYNSETVGFVGFNQYDNSAFYAVNSTFDGGCFEGGCVLVYGSTFGSIMFQCFSNCSLANSIGQDLWFFDFCSIIITNSSVGSAEVTLYARRDLQNLQPGFINDFESDSGFGTSWSNITIADSTFGEWTIEAECGGFTLENSKIACIIFDALDRDPGIAASLCLPSGQIGYWNFTIPNNIDPIVIVNSTVDSWDAYVWKGNYTFTGSCLRKLIVGPAMVTVSDSTIMLLSARRAGGTTVVSDSTLGTVQLGSYTSALDLTLQEGYHDEFSFFNGNENVNVTMQNVTINHWGIVSYGNATVTVHDTNLSGPFAILGGVFFAGVFSGDNSSVNIVNSNVTGAECFGNAVCNVVNSTVGEGYAYDNSTFNVVNSTVGVFMDDPPTINMLNSKRIAEIVLPYQLPDGSLTTNTSDTCVFPLPSNVKQVGECLQVNALFTETLETQIRMFYDKTILLALGIDENNLKIYCLEENSTSWTQCPVQGVNTEEDYVWANVTSYSTFVIGGEASGLVTGGGGLGGIAYMK